LCSVIFFELLPGNFFIEWPIVGFNVLESWSFSIIPHISFNESYHIFNESHWIASDEPKVKLLQVVPNELLDPIVDQISLPTVSMNNCALLDYNPLPPAPNFVAQVTRNRQLD
jgi:hypothetical protein